MEAYIHLENGVTFTGEQVNGAGDTSGEVVFFTGMTGYQEVITDPSYAGQVIVFTYPYVGNYGIQPNDFESTKPHVKAVVVYETKDVVDHSEATMTLVDYLTKWNIPLIKRVDTRGLVKTIREHGAMRAVVTTEAVVDEVKFHEQVEQPVPYVSTKSPYTVGQGDQHLVVVDFGYKQAMVETLVARGYLVTVVPYDTTFESIAALHPAGILLSNGPGDPKALSYLLPTIKQLCETYPTLAICLGHQLVSLAYGANTVKLLYGHRGANHPVYDKWKRRAFMTSQNHGYVVEQSSLEQCELVVRFTNVNDQSVEGCIHPNLPLLTAQFHPEAHPGPVETAFLFDEWLHFVTMKEKKYA